MGPQSISLCMYCMYVESTTHTHTHAIHMYSTYHTMASLGMANISDGSIMSIMSSVMYSFLMALYVYTVSRSNKDKSHQSTKGSYLKPPAALPA